MKDADHSRRSRRPRCCTTPARSRCPEHILNKPGKLTPAEFEKMKLPRADRRGDPLGDRLSLSGRADRASSSRELGRHRLSPMASRATDIPIGARILSVVDCFDALTSDRPYRRAHDRGGGASDPHERRGTMYDPLVVDVFSASYKRIMPAEESVAHPATRAVGGAREAAAAPAVTDAEMQRAATDAPIVNEVLAISSLARAVAGNASLSDVGALAWVTLRGVVPGELDSAVRRRRGTRPARRWRTRPVRMPLFCGR